MKRSFAAVAALGAISGAAYAQGSVTLYGIADAGFLYLNNTGGHSVLEATSGNEQSSRWGLRVQEDLGGGLNATAKLENGFSIMNGTASQNGRLFGREAWVGLSSNAYGTLTMGRQYSTFADQVSPVNFANNNLLTFLSAHPLDNDNIDATYRIDNSVKYVSPVYRGFQAEAMYGFSNSTSFAVNRAYSGALGYTNSAVHLAVAYTRLNFPGYNKDTVGAIPSDSYYTQSFLASATTVQQWGAGGTFNVGRSTFGVLYTDARFQDPATGSLFSGPYGSGGGKGSVRFQNIEGNVRYQFTPFLFGGIAETYTHAMQGKSSGNYWQTSAGIQYYLSKRTNFYADAYYQKTSRNLNATFALTGTPSSTSSQVAVTIGIRHKF